MAKTLAEKLKVQPGSRICVVGVPDGYLEELAPIDCDIDTAIDGEYDWIQVFVKSKGELDALFPKVFTALKPIGHLWISYPKGVSKLQTDLTRDKGWQAVNGLKWVTLCAVNETWSAFCFRHPKKGEVLNDWRDKM